MNEQGARRRSATRRVVVWGCIVAALVVVTVHAGSIWHVAQAWWHGRLVSGTVVWHAPVRVWARIGKFLQLLGGVTVAAEILGADRFRRWSETWRQRRLDRRTRSDRIAAAHPLVTLREAIYESLVYERVYWEATAGSDGPPPSRMLIASGGPPAVAATDRVRQADIAAWHAATMAALPSAHACGRPHGWHGGEACHEQVMFARSATDKFLRSRLTGADWALLEAEASAALDARSGFLWALSMVLFAPLIVVLCVGLHDISLGRERIGVPGIALAAAFVSGFFGLGAAVSAGDAPPRSRAAARFFRLIVWVQTVPLAVLMRAVAAAIDRARPSNALKWFAFWAFVVGFGPDFLGS